MLYKQNKSDIRKKFCRTAFVETVLEFGAAKTNRISYSCWAKWHSCLHE